MKKITLILLFIAAMAMTFATWAQDNPSNAATLLNVPQEFVKYNGQIQKKIQYDLTEYRTIDFTNVDTINGKLVKKVDTTYTYASVPTTQNFGAYGLNILSSYIHSFGYSVQSDSELNKPAFWGTTPTGPFMGETYYFGYSNVNIIPMSGGYNYEVLSYPYMTTETNGLPAITPWMSIKQVTTTITGSVSISQPRFEVKITNVRKNTGKQTNVKYTKDKLEKQSKLSEAQISNYTKTVFQIFTTSGNTHCNSTGTKINKNGSTYSGTVYFNGADAKTINYKNLMASYGMKLNSYVTRWHLYNGSVNNSVYGSTFTKQMTENELTDITIVAGSSFSYDGATNTLTYDANKPAELWFQYELLPAQGKSPSWESRINIATGEVIWK